MRGAAAGREAGFRPSVVEFTFVGLLWCIRLVQGRLSELEPLVEGVRTMPNRPAWWFANEAQLACERGDREAARRALADSATAGLLQTPRGLAWTPTMTSAADACATLDERSLAAPLYELLAPCADVMAVQSGPVGRAVGRLALTLGRRDEAEAHLRVAVALCERMDARAFLVIARYELGRLLLPGPEGTVLVEQARATAEELGMPGWARQARAALASADGPHAA